MSNMFCICQNIKQIIGVNKFNTAKVTNMEGMFQLCINLEYLDLSNFNTNNVSNMSFMFNGCQTIKQIIGINKFNTTKVTNMEYMFQLCS